VLHTVPLNFWPPAVDSSGICWKSRVPSGLVVDTSDHKAYVTSFNYNYESFLTIVDGTTYATSEISIPVVPIPDTVIGALTSSIKLVDFNPVNHKIYVTGSKVWEGGSVQEKGAVYIYRFPGYGEISTYEAVGQNPIIVKVNPANNNAYVLNSGSSSVSVIDGSSNALIAEASTEAAPDAMDINPATNKIYVANGGSNSVTVINGATNSVEAFHITVGATPVAIAVDPDPNLATNLKKVFVANLGDNSVSVIDGNPSSPTYNTVITTISNVKFPFHISINPKTKKVYVCDLGDYLKVMPAVMGVLSGGVSSDVLNIVNLMYDENTTPNTMTIIDGYHDTKMGSPVRLVFVQCPQR
jgi:YVTN family beta-propeller protein